MARRRQDFFRLAAAVLFLADQVAKFIVSRSIPLSASIPVLPGLFNLTYLLNPGAAFGFLSRWHPSFRNPFFIGISVLAILFVFLYYWRQGRARPLFTLGLGLIAGGALGNLWDRLWRGAVVDFLDFYVGRHHWPAFNLADSGISVGVALLIWQLWKEGSRIQGFKGSR
ncbi:MAG: signal peptidase II [candidate division NC10 bacterium]|nr:signal peptidase II [candidate division NC10 bacterium]